MQEAGKVFHAEREMLRHHANIGASSADLIQIELSMLEEIDKLKAAVLKLSVDNNEMKGILDERKRQDEGSNKKQEGKE